MRVTLEYEVDDSWAEYQQISHEEMEDRLVYTAKEGFDAEFADGANSIILLSSHSESEKESNRLNRR